jgi:hypothetical protein
MRVGTIGGGIIVALLVMMRWWLALWLPKVIVAAIHVIRLNAD